MEPLDNWSMQLQVLGTTAYAMLLGGAIGFDPPLPMTRLSAHVHIPQRDAAGPEHQAALPMQGEAFGLAVDQ